MSDVAVPSYGRVMKRHVVEASSCAAPYSSSLTVFGSSASCDCYCGFAGTCAAPTATISPDTDTCGGMKQTVTLSEACQAAGNVSSLQALPGKGTGQCNVSSSSISGSLVHTLCCMN